MQTLIKATAVCALSAMFAGCTTTSYKADYYRDSNSKAFNIANAGSIYGIKDTHAPNNFDVTGAALTGVDLFSTFYSNPSLGLTNWSSLGMGLINGFSKEEADFSNLIAWLPKSTPEMSFQEAQTKMESIVDQAVAASLNNKGVSFEKKDGEFNSYTYTLVKKSWGCYEAGN